MSIVGQRGGEPEISVVIPARNAATTIAETLASLATEADLIRDLIVVVDKSLDDTAAVVARHAKQHGLPLKLVTVLVGDAGAARNAGIAEATGRYVYFIDADDLHVRGGLRALHQRLESSPGAGVAIGTVVREVDGLKSRHKRISGLGANRARNAERLLADRLGSIAMGTVLLRRVAIGDDRFPVGLAYDEDTLFWARILSTTDAIAIGQQILVYRVGTERSDERFTQASRTRFLRWLREARRLEGNGVAAPAIAERAAIIAFKIARTHYSRGNCGQSERFIGIASRLWRSVAGRQRLRRYRHRIATLCAQQPAGIEAAIAMAPVFALVVGVDPFAAPISGVDLRNWQNARALAELGPVIIASLHPAKTADLQAPHRGIVAAALSFDGEKHSASISRHRTPIDPRVSRMALARLLVLVGRVRPRIVVIEGVNLWPLLKPLRPLVPTIILDMHNVESDLAMTVQTGRQRFTRPATSAARLRKRERAAADIVDRVWVSSDIDRARARAFCPAERPIDIVPNGIPRPEGLPDRLAPCRRGGGSLNLLFVGHLGYVPNVRAATRLAKRIVPQLRRVRDGVRLTIAGRAPDASIRALTDLDFVTVVANPDDLRLAYSEADVVVIPLMEGGGTRIKILEAMAHGVPVVATSVAAEGLSLRDGNDIVIADSDAQFVERILGLTVGHSYETIRQSAFECVVARFGRAAITDAIRKAVQP